MKWEKVKLSEVTEYITDGDHQPAPKSDSGVLFVKIKDIQDNRLAFDNALFVPQEYYNRLPKNRKAEYGDTLYTVVGSYGIPAFVNHRSRSGCNQPSFKNAKLFILSLERTIF